jgi:pantoate--beta-alanine ligase
MSDNRPEVVRTVAAMRHRVGGWRRAGGSVGVVPTMGALHDGHLALVRRARAECDRVIVTIFVNPTQFGENEDLTSYPRQEASDLAKLTELETDLVFAPDAAEMYPGGFATKVNVEGISEGLCGGGRPTHFSGVATVVSKLFIQAGADRAYFGEKDYQQLQIVRRMARDLDIPIEIIGVETVREADGLAMSSRNAHLTPDQRRVAASLYRVMRAVAARLAAGDPTVAAVAEGRAELEGAAFDRVEYLELCDAETLAPVTTLARSARLFVAAYLGQTRLIDNIPVS